MVSAGAVIFLAAPGAQEQGYFSEKMREWSVRVDTVGGKQAYEEFKEQNGDEEYSYRHLAAHAFGEVLYRRMGSDAIAVCDDDFSYGCYHSVFSHAFAIKGDHAVKEFGEICSQKFSQSWACQHGIGHGILEFLGSDNLLEALEVCTRLPSYHQKNLIDSCAEGVFMEYNAHLVDIETATVQVRPFDPLHPYTPCDAVEETFAPSCYFGLARWWRMVFNNNFAQAGDLCHGIPGAKERELCFLGLGSAIPLAIGCHPFEVGEICSVMPTLEEQVLCRAGAQWYFLDHAACYETGKALCENLPSPHDQLCRVKSQLLP